ncbi:vitellogenin receptor-like protein, partial [Leptotrombidium deliense]
MNQCDDYPDCPNGKDEVDCHDPLNKFERVTCPKGFYKCKHSDRCLPGRWKCDNHKHCPHGDDEINCNSSDAHCNGFLCADMNYELNCNKTSDKDMVGCSKDNGFFECASTEYCILYEKVCDNTKDCPQGDDEGPHCIKNDCNDLRCSGHCVNTASGAKCYCDEGYNLDDDGRTCVDTDECEMMHDSQSARCSHKCSNVAGSYVCECLNGYTLAADKHNCEADGEEPILFFSD